MKLYRRGYLNKTACHEWERQLMLSYFLIYKPWFKSICWDCISSTKWNLFMKFYRSNFLIMMTAQAVFLFQLTWAEGLVVRLMYWQASPVYCLLTFSVIFSSETTGPIEAKSYLEMQWDGGKKVYSQGWGHMARIAAMPIYAKNPSKIFFYRTTWPIPMKFSM